MATYRRIVQRLEEAGHRVLAGMVTNDAVTAGGEDLSAEAIFVRDMAWLAEAAAAGGVLVAEVSRPSHGVGYEIAAARYRFGMPVICLYRPAFTRRCSGMLAGDSGIRLIEYTDEATEAMMADLLAELGE